MKDFTFVLFALFCLGVPLTSASQEPIEKGKNSPTGFRSVRFVDDQNGWLSGSRGVFCTRDGGKNWKRLSATIGESHVEEDPLRGLRLEPGRILWASANKAIIRGQKGIITCSCDEGMWQETNNDVYQTLGRIAFFAYDKGWGVSGKGDLYYTDDQGNHWKPMPFVFQTGQIRDLLATTAEELWAISLGGSVFHSTDGGKNWDKNEVGKDYIMLTSIYFCNPDVGWIVNLRGTIFMTENRGEFWKRILEFSEVPIFTLIDLAFRNSQEGWVLGEAEPKSPRALGKGMFIYYTRDGGRKWKVQEKGISDFLISIQTLPKGVVWVAGRQGTVLTTSDYGKTWRRVLVE